LFTIYKPRYGLNPNSDNTSRGPDRFASLRVNASITIPLKKLSHLYIYTYINAPRVFERASSTPTSHAAETEFSIHNSTKPTLTCGRTQRPLNHNEGARHTDLPRLASRPVRRSHHQESQYEIDEPQLASYARKLVESTPSPFHFPANQSPDDSLKVERTRRNILEQIRPHSDSLEASLGGTAQHPSSLSSNDIHSTSQFGANTNHRNRSLRPKLASHV
jgi:hypothetical protein